MAIAFVDSEVGSSAALLPDTASTSPAATNTGADFLVVGVASYQGQPTYTVTDDATSPANTYVNRSAYTEGLIARVRNSYLESANTTSSQIWSVNGAGGFYSLCGLSFSGVAASGAYDTESGNFTSGDTSLAPGALTASVNGAVYILTICWNANVTSISENTGLFTLAGHVDYISSENFGLSVWYYIQPTAAEVNPTISWTTSTIAAATMSVFKPVPPAGGSPHRAFALLGVG